MNIKNIMNELFYSENPKPKLDKTKEDKKYFGKQEIFFD